ncbi:Histidinol-phosphate aminotransferase [Zancudomyces culisetae]|uniref:histidinol-phosphate transaminase n=1 Tax=Zancudomyces culisetae TaxID=1213189 RepID=A0A1R1PFL9_ZANCU|nr:Histidinol-phosphate aminotransferase [Zancudomyces culisetae]|eukprot:OMH79805.1 Histidinol-phosphate aminotransferase [Zancudomyces culisetae]
MVSESFNLENIVRKNILKLKPYRCARDDYNTGTLLDANENTYGAVTNLCVKDGALLETPKKDELEANRYPDPLARKVKNRFIKLRNIDSVDNVFVGVGSDEVIDIVVRVFCEPKKDKILITPPTYGMYSVVANINDVGIEAINLITENGSFQLNTSEVVKKLEEDSEIKIVFLCSPGNPTGTSLDLKDIEKILNSRYNGIVVVDEAYVDFVSADDNQYSLAQMATKYKNLVVMQTLSKSFGLAGVRLGFGISNPAIIELFNRIKPPYNISVLSQEYGYLALSDDSLAVMKHIVGKIKSQRDNFLVPKLVELPGINAILGGNNANFVLAQFVDSDGSPDNQLASFVYKTCADSLGLVIRFRGNEPGCEGCLRVSVGTPTENVQLVEKIRRAVEMYNANN